VLEGIGGVKENRAVDQGVEARGGDPASGADILADDGVEVVEQGLALLAVRLRHAVAGEGLICRFVLEETPFVESQPHFFEQLLLEGPAHDIALELQHALGIEDDAVGDAGEVVFGHAAAFEKDDDFFVRPAHLLQLFTEFPDQLVVGCHAGEVERDAGDGGILDDALEVGKEGAEGEGLVVEPAEFLVADSSADVLGIIAGVLAQQDALPFPAEAEAVIIAVGLIIPGEGAPGVEPG